jgi:hypothetical protein
LLGNRAGMGRNHMQLAPWCEKRSVLTLRVVCFRVHVWLCELFSFVQSLVRRCFARTMNTIRHSAAGGRAHTSDNNPVTHVSTSSALCDEKSRHCCRLITEKLQGSYAVLHKAIHAGNGTETPCQYPQDSSYLFFPRRRGLVCDHPVQRQVYR